jgi:cobalamin biosynthesis protein CobT
MNRKSFISSLPIVAKAIGNRLGITITMGGESAYTNGTNINIPSLPDTEEAYVLARGYIDHEAGHIRHTNFAVAFPQGLEFHLWNIFEDVRIERETGREFIGCAHNLHALCGTLTEQGAFSPAGNNHTDVLCSFLLSTGRYEVLGQPVKELAAKTAKQLEKLFGSKLAKVFRGIATEVHGLATTEDAAALARKVMGILKQEQQAMKQQQEQEKKQEKKQDSDSGDQGQGEKDDSEQDQEQTSGNGADDSGKGEGQGAGSGSESDEDAADGKGSGGSGAEEGDEDGEGSGSGSSHGSKEEQAGDKSSSDPDSKQTGSGGSGAGGCPMSEEEMQELLAGKGRKDLSISSILEKLLQAQHDAAERWGMISAISMIPAEDGILRTSRLDDSTVRRETAKLRAKIHGFLQASKLKRSLPRRSGHKIESRVLHRLAVADTRVYASRNYKEGVNTAITILLDRSGSMQGEKMIVANESAYAAALALQSVPGVACSVAAFPAYSETSGWDCVYPLTSFGEKVKPDRYGIQADGSTPLHSALAWARAQVLRRQEPRKIVLVVTDGEPDDHKRAKQAIKHMEKEGIELLGLGILDDNVTRLFKSNAVVNKIAELPEALFGMLEESLKG